MRILALVLSLSIVNYGAMATAAVHSHDHDGFHQVHAVVDSDHHDDHHADETAPAAPVSGKIAEQAQPAPEHTETGLHSHSTPQFGPHDYALAFVADREFVRLTPVDPDALRQLHRERPPHQPPRAIL